MPIDHLFDDAHWTMLQEQLWIAFAYPIRWWIIIFLVFGVLASAFTFAYVFLSRWTERS